MKYCDLDRQFIEVDAGSDVEEAAARSYLAKWSGRACDGDGLLKERRVAVVLGEAGSGKTEELKEHARRLQAKGRSAFFIDIARLATHSLVDSVDPKDKALFSTWLSSPQLEASFFLDSVDEARLTSLAALKNALHNFGNGVAQDALAARTRVVISCRVSEWRGQADLLEVMHRFEVKSEGGASKKAKDIAVLELAPLDWPRIDKFARHIDPNRANSFLAAIRDADAEDFARRPKDVIDLFGFWTGRGTLGSLQEVVHYDVTNKLKESEERKASDKVPPERLLRGAEQLAAAAVLCRGGAFSLPSVLVDPALAATSISPSEVLGKSWSPNEISSLLGRPLFDEATLGRVRFHHRTSVEYLCARWLQARKEAGCTFRELLDVLFRDIRGRRLLRKPLAASAAWLALSETAWSKRILNELIRVSPETLLLHGDPSRLPAETKRSILSKLVASTRSQKRIWLNLDAAQLKRIADPALAADIAKWIADPTLALELKDILLDVARLGSLTACADVALQIARDKSADGLLRQSALLAAAELAPEASLRSLRDDLLAEPKLSARFIASVARALYPKVLDVDGLATLLGKAPAIGRYSSEDLPYTLKQIPRDMDEASALRFLESLLSLLSSPPSGVTREDHKRGLLWLRPVLHALARRLLANPALAEKTMFAVSRLLLELRYLQKLDPTGEEKKPLQEATLKHASLRQFYAWRRYEALGRRDGDPDLFWPFDYRDAIGPDASDLAWLMADMQGTDITRAKVATSWACAVYRSTETSKPLLRAIRKAAGHNRELARTVRKMLPLIPMVWRHRLQYRLWEYFRFGWRRHASKIAGLYYEARNQLNIRWDKADITSGKAFGYLPHLHSVACRNDEDKLDFGEPPDSRRVGAKYGRAVELAFRSGAKKAWRDYEPPLPSASGVIQSGLTVGLAGILLDLQDGWTFTTATATEAYRAARYAVRGLAAFPEWTSALVKARPNEFLNVVRECLAQDWTVPETSYHSSVLQNAMMSADETVRKAVAGATLEKLQESSPASQRVLQDALDLLTKADNEAAIRALCAGRAGDPNTPLAMRMLWLSTWTSFDPKSALDAFDSLLKEPGVDAEHVTVELAAGVASRRRPAVSQRIDGWPARTLGRCLLVLNTHMKATNDIDRIGGGVYSPTPRDTAQEFRDRLITLILESKDSDAYDVLQGLAKEPALAKHHEYLRHVATQRLQSEADGGKWAEPAVEQFALEHESDPLTGDDLYTIVCRRLDDARDEVETDDYSRRKEVTTDAKENELQKWLAKHLRDNSRGRYSEVRESEVDDDKEPDIRVMRTGLAAQTMIEIKWADLGWSYQQLSDAITTQLIGQYLRASTSRHGIFFVANLGRKGWDGPSGALDFEGLVTQLKADAAKALAANSDIEQLSVCGVDFTSPHP